jgi:16S rRNA (cytidine1402-2'-O)-methyltransferase
MIFKPGLYIVSTPIGNLDDITIRAIQTLKNSNIILCEDTRISRKLLAKHSITAKLQVYNDHSDEKQREVIKDLIGKGAVISLISDAGTPLISDPGYKLVRQLINYGCYVDIIPGVSSPITALTISALPSDRFLFAGFLPKTLEGKKNVFKELSKVRATLIFFETANRLQQSLVTALDIFGNREACVARELTKLYQEARRGQLDEIIKFYQDASPKGEVVMLISGYAEKVDEQLLVEDLKQLLESYLSKGCTAKGATELAYEKFGELYSKKEIYSIANKIRDKFIN